MEDTKNLTAKERKAQKRLHAKRHKRAYKFEKLKVLKTRVWWTNNGYYRITNLERSVVPVYLFSVHVQTPYLISLTPNGKPFTNAHCQTVFSSRSACKKRGHQLKRDFKSQRQVSQKRYKHYRRQEYNRLKGYVK